MTHAILFRMQSEGKTEQETKRPSEKLRARRQVEALSDDEEEITVRAPIAQLLQSS